MNKPETMDDEEIARNWLTDHVWDRKDIEVGQVTSLAKLLREQRTVPAKVSASTSTPHDWNKWSYNEGKKPLIVSILRNLINDALGIRLTERHGSIMDARQFLRDGSVEKCHFKEEEEES